MSVTVLMILFTLQITTSNIQEQQCDFLYGQGCICNLSQVLADIQDILTYPVSVHFVNDLLSEASVRIVQYQCKDYKPLPPGFDVTLQTTPSRVAGLSNDSGRLSFSSEEFAKRLYEYTLVENVNIIYAFPGSDQRFSCIVGSRDILKDISAPQYVWNLNGKTNLSTSDERATIHKRSGDLTISDVEPNDKGTYNCIVSYDNDNSETIEQEFRHDLEVITIPQYTILGTVLYLTHNTDCKDEILELIELYLPTLLYDVLCRMDDPSHGHLCKISAGNPVCQTVQNLKQVSISLHLDLIQSPLYFPSLRSGNNVNCNPICQLKIYAKLLSIFERNVKKTLKLPIFANATFIMSDLIPNYNKIRTRMLIGCKAGYYFFDSYCVPCPPNHFSLEASTTCLKCKLGYYQPRYGSKDCKPSIKGIQNIKLINVASEWNWKLFVIVFVIFAVLLVVFCLIQQVAMLFLPLRIAVKCISIVFSLIASVFKLLWSIISISIVFVFTTLFACCRLLYWRRKKKDMESSEKNDAGSVNFQATEEETWRLLPENRNSKAVKFDTKKPKFIRTKKNDLRKVKMKAKRSNTKNNRFQRLTDFMRRSDEKQKVSILKLRNASSSSELSDVSSNVSSLAPRLQQSPDRNKADTLTKKPVEANSNKSILKDALLISDFEDDLLQQENVDEKVARPDGLDFVHLHTKLRK